MEKKLFKIQKEIGTRLKKKNILNNQSTFIKNNAKMMSGKKKLMLMVLRSQKNYLIENL